MAVAFDAKCTATTEIAAVNGTTGKTSSNLTITGSGSALLAVLIGNGAANVTSPAMVWDSGGTNQSMTQIGSTVYVHTVGWIALFGLVSPAAGAKVLKATWSGTLTGYLASMSFSGTDTTSVATCFTNFNSGTPTGSTGSFPITGANGNYAFASNSNNDVTYSPFINATSSSLLFSDINKNYAAAAYAPEVGTTTTFSWSQSGSEQNVVLGCTIVAASTGTNASATGVNAVGAVGTFTTKTDDSSSVTGVTGTGGIGTVIAQISPGALAGVTGTGGVGTFTTRTDDSASITGVNATGAVGTFVGFPTNVSVSGVAGTGGVGTVIAKDSANITGVNGTGGVGSLTSSGAYSTYITASNGYFTDGSGNVYDISSGLLMMENNSQVSGGSNTGAMDYYNSTVYAQDATTLDWYTWNGSSFAGPVSPPGNLPGGSSATGVAGTGAAGTPKAQVSASPAGVAGTGAAGTSTIQVSVSPIGVAGTGAAGTVADTISSSASPAGVAGTGAAGTSTVQVSASPAGVAGTGAAGTSTAKVSALPTGVACTGAVGTSTIQVSASPAGVAGTGAAGTSTAKVSVSPTGVTGTGAAGAPTAQVSKPSTGVSGTGAVGSVAVSLFSWRAGIADASIAELAIATEDVLASEGQPVSVGLIGAVAVTAANIDYDRNASVTGVAATGAVGSATPSVDPTPGGLPTGSGIFVTQLGTASGSVVSSVTITLTSSVPAGSTIFVVFAGNLSGSPLTLGVSDSTGQTWIPAPTAAGQTSPVQLAYAWNAHSMSAGATITVGTSTATNMAATAFYASELLTASTPFDACNWTASSSGAVTCNVPASSYGVPGDLMVTTLVWYEAVTVNIGQTYPPFQPITMAGTNTGTHDITVAGSTAINPTSSSFGYVAAANAAQAYAYVATFRCASIGTTAYTYAGTVAYGVSYGATLTGVSGTGAVGTPIVSESVPLTGVSGAGAVGSVIPSIGESVSLTGVSGTGAVGTSTAKVSVSPTGVAGTGAAGTSTAKVSVSPTGVAGTGAAGTSKVQVSASPTGVAGTGATGAPTDTISSSVSLTGVAGTGAAGIETPGSGSVVQIVGVSGTGVAGVASDDYSSNVALTGVSATSAAGSVSPGVNQSASLSGVSATGAVGTSTVKVSALPTGVAGTGVAGTSTAQLSVSITGVAGTSAVGAVSPASNPLFGASATTAAGTLTIGDTSNVAISGVAATGAVGSILIGKVIPIGGAGTGAGVFLTPIGSVTGNDYGFDSTDTITLPYDIPANSVVFVASNNIAFNGQPVQLYITDSMLLGWNYGPFVSGQTVPPSLAWAYTTSVMPAGSVITISTDSNSSTSRLRGLAATAFYATGLLLVTADNDAWAAFSSDTVTLYDPGSSNNVTGNLIIAIGLVDGPITDSYSDSWSDSTSPLFTARIGTNFLTNWDVCVAVNSRVNVTNAHIAYEATTGVNRTSSAYLATFRCSSVGTSAYTFAGLITIPANLTGAVAITSSGIIQATGPKSFAVTGAVATTTAGSVIPAQGSLTSALASTAAGAVSGIEVDLPLIGSTATTSGSLSNEIDLSLAGSAATTAAGAITPQYVPGVTLTGAVAITAASAPAIEIDLSVTLTGVGGEGDVGQVLCGALLPSQLLTASAGTIVPDIDCSAAISGVSATGSVGTVIGQGGVLVPIGAQGTGAGVFVTEIGSAVAGNPSSTITITLSSAIPAHSTIMVVFGCLSATGVLTISDSTSQTWTNATLGYDYTHSVAQAVPQLAYCWNGHAMAAGTTITVASGINCKAMAAIAFWASGLLIASTPFDNYAFATDATGALICTDGGSISNATGDLMIGTAVMQGPVSDSFANSFSLGNYADIARVGTSVGTPGYDITVAVAANINPNNSHIVYETSATARTGYAYLATFRCASIGTSAYANAGTLSDAYDWIMAISGAAASTSAGSLVTVGDKVAPLASALATTTTGGMTSRSAEPVTGASASTSGGILAPSSGGALLSGTGTTSAATIGSYADASPFDAVGAISASGAIGIEVDGTLISATGTTIAGLITPEFNQTAALSGASAGTTAGTIASALNLLPGASATSAAGVIGLEGDGIAQLGSAMASTAASSPAVSAMSFRSGIASFSISELPVTGDDMQSVAINQTALPGAIASAAAGSVTVQNSLTGAQVAGSAGIVSGQVTAASVSLTGASGTTAAGNLINAAYDIPLIGTTASTAAGAVGQTVVSDLSGALAVTSPGIITFTEAVSVALSGVSGSGAVGTVTPGIGQGTFVTGASASTTAGTPGTSIGLPQTGAGGTTACGTSATEAMLTLPGASASTSAPAIGSSSSSATSGAQASTAAGTPVSAPAIGLSGAVSGSQPGSVALISATQLAGASVTASGGAIALFIASNVALPSTPCSALAGAIGAQRFEPEAAYILVAVPPKNRMIAKAPEGRQFRVAPQPRQAERSVDDPIVVAPSNRTFIAS